MGNLQTNEKQSKTGKSPAKGKNFIGKLNRKSPGRDSKKHGRKKSDGKRGAIDREFDKTPDSDNVEVIEASDNDTVECSSKTLQEGEGEWSVQSEVTVSRCGRSVTRPQPAAAAVFTALGDRTRSTDSVFTDSLAPAVELNLCYYSAESDSLPAASASATLTPTTPRDMPHDDAASSISHDDVDKEENKNDVFDDSPDKNEEKVMGAIFSSKVLRSESVKRTNHECSHDFLDNRIKACPGQTSFTISKHRKVELPPVEHSLTLLDDDDG